MIKRHDALRPCILNFCFEKFLYIFLVLIGLFTSLFDIIWSLFNDLISSGPYLTKLTDLLTLPLTKQHVCLPHLI